MIPVIPVVPVVTVSPVNPVAPAVAFWWWGREPRVVAVAFDDRLPGRVRVRLRSGVEVIVVGIGHCAVTAVMPVMSAVMRAVPVMRPR